MKKILIFASVLIVVILTSGLSDVFGQSLSLQYPVLNDYFRRQQLLGVENPDISYHVRPIVPNHAFNKRDFLNFNSEAEEDKTSNEKEMESGFPKLKSKILPVQILNQYNSLYAFGGNDGIMVPNRGIQSVISFGVFLNYRSFSFQFQPELLFAQNREYIGYPIEHQSSVLIYYEYLNRIDLPERFGNSVYQLLLPGQSSLRYNLGAFSIGASTENLWWGPGRKNSLIMSNNAPGFFHYTINTSKPAKTAIGSFEGQLISGNLSNSNALPPHYDYSIQNNPVYIPKREGKRYLSGIVVSYQPKWVKGLSFGYASVNHMYEEDMNSFKDYLPIFNGEKGLNNVYNPTRDARQQLSSGFFRWMTAEGHFEFYGEYGTNGNSRRFKDFIITPEKNRAFTLGFSNLIPLKRPEQYLQIGAEMTQTGQTIRESIRNLDTWYIHNHVRQGYTHYGQVLGVGYGPAANVNWLEIAWVKNFNKIGFEFERIVYNNDYYYYRYEESKDLRNKYVDLVPALVADLKVGDFLLNGSIKHVNTLNYKWYLENDPDFYVVPGFDRKNLHVNLGIAYVFK
jgi:hypothetical protein